MALRYLARPLGPGSKVVRDRLADAVVVGLDEPLVPVPRDAQELRRAQGAESRLALPHVELRGSGDDVIRGRRAGDRDELEEPTIHRIPHLDSLPEHLLERGMCV